MAPRQKSNDSTNDIELDTLDLIFSCGICQATVAETYAADNRQYGLHSGDKYDEGAVTKVWIADCSHVFCGKHLEGGGIPFHPAGVENAKVTCPVCVLLRGDHQQKEVFWIRGLARGQHHDVIPETWFICPPAKLDSQNPLDDAFRFQYTSLDRYALQATKHWRSTERKRRLLEKHHAQERKAWEKKEADLMARNAKLEAKVAKWEGRRGMVEHWVVRQVPVMLEEISQLRDHLRQLGYQVSNRDYQYYPDKNARQPNQAAPAEGEQEQSSAKLVGDTSSQKRKRPPQDHPDGLEEPTQNQSHETHQMMPPPLPVKRGSRRPRQETKSAPRREEPYQHIQETEPLHSVTGGPQFQPEAQAQEARPVYRSKFAPPPSSRIGIHVGSQLQESNHPQASRGVQNGYRKGPTATDVRMESRGFTNLPYRPVQEAQSKQGSVYGGQNDDRYHVGQQQYSTQHSEAPSQQPNGLLAMAPRRRSQVNRNAPAQDSYFGQPHVRRDAPRPPRAQHYNSGYGTMAEQSGDQAPRELQGFQEDARPPRSSAVSRPNYQGAPTPSQRRLADPTASSVLSPFFKGQSQSQSMSMRPQSTQRPPSRGSVALPQYASNVPRALAAERQYRAPVASSSYGTINRPRASQPRVPPSRDNYRLYSASQQPQQHFNAVNSQPMYTSQPPQRSECLSRRPELPPPRPQAYQPPPSSSHRSRITLPSGSSRIPLNDSQDPQLSRIQGVRGSAGLPRYSYSRQGVAVPTPSRSLYSAAGSRRQPVYR